MMKRLTLLVVGVAMIGVLPAGADPTQEPVIESVSPGEILARSPDTTITITGSGFSAPTGSPRLRGGTYVYMNFQELQATVVDDGLIEATVPASMLEYPDTHEVFVFNGFEPRTFGTRLAGRNSNSKQIEVVRRTSPRLEFTFWDHSIDPYVAGRCMAGRISFTDSYDEPLTGNVRLTATSEPDGAAGVTLYHESCESGDEITEPVPIEGRLLFWFMIHQRGTVSFFAEEVGSGARTSEGPMPVLGAWFRGTVTDAAGIPVAGVRVSASRDPLDNSAAFGVIPGSYWECGNGSDDYEDLLRFSRYPGTDEGIPIGVTDAQGRYKGTAVAPGRWALRFEPPAGSRLATSWSGGHFDPYDALRIALDDAQTEQVDATLVSGGAMSGTLLADGHGLANASVHVRDTDSGQVLDIARTNGDGSYSTAGLRPGTYAVEFDPRDHAPAWYGGGDDVLSAGRVTVTAGAITPDVDAATTAGGSVRAELEPGPGRFSYGYGYLLSSDSGEVEREFFVDPDFTLLGVAPGKYRAFVSPSSGVATWHDRAWSFADAADITVSAGGTSRIDIRRPTGTRIVGLVTGPPGRGPERAVPFPMSHVSVDVFDATTRIRAASGCTDLHGMYETGELPPGVYHVRFRPNVGVAAGETWLGGAPSRDASPTLTVGAEDRVRADQALPLGGSIRVTATAPDGSPVDHGWVAAWPDGSDDRGDATMGWLSDGVLELPRLAPGTYRLETRAADAGGTVWHPRSNSRGAGAPVLVAPGETTIVDHAFLDEGEVRGTLSALPDSVDGWVVELYDARTRELSSRHWANGTSFSIPANPGSYFVRFVTGSRKAPAWHGGNSIETARRVRVRSGKVVEAIDASLMDGRAIRGRVVAEHSGQGIAGVRVEIVDALSGALIREDASLPDGRFITAGLAPGVYKARLSGTTLYHQTWVGGSSFADAEQIVVGSSADASTDPVTLRLRRR